MPDLGSGCRAFESPRPDKVDVRFNSPTKTDWKLSTNHYGACSSVGRASDCGSEGPGFETLLTPISAGVAQLAERLPSKQEVAGSNPVSRSTHLKYRNKNLCGCSSLGLEYRLAMAGVVGSNPIIRSIRRCSSVGLERMTHNHEIVGSNPTVATAECSVFSQKSTILLNFSYIFCIYSHTKTN